MGMRSSAVLTIVSKVLVSGQSLGCSNLSLPWHALMLGSYVAWLSESLVSWRPEFDACIPLTSTMNENEENGSKRKPIPRVCRPPGPSMAGGRWSSSPRCLPLSVRQKHIETKLSFNLEVWT